MTDKKQPEALRLADWLQAAVQTYPQMSEDEPGGYASEVDQIMDEAAAELRRLHAENEALRTGYDAARLEVESLQRRVQEVGAVARREHERADRAMRAFADATCALRTPHEQAPAQAAPAAVAGQSDLRTRCDELLAWRKTGVLPGEALRTLAREKYGDEYDALQRAERDTETEALNFVIATPTTQPAPQPSPASQVDALDAAQEGK